MLYSSLAIQSYKRFKILFVDNNSSDGSSDFSKEISDKSDLDIEYISLAENSGFAKGNNIGAEWAIEDECDYVSILNNDTELDPNGLRVLVRLAESDDSIGVVGPIVFLLARQQVDKPDSIVWSALGLQD